MNRYFLLLFTLFTLDLKAAPTKESIKRELASEMAALSKDLDHAQEQLGSLITDNANMKVDLKNMENWGIGQQQEKDAYYIQLNGILAKNTQLEKALAAKQHEQDQIKAKYDHSRSFLAYIAGAVLAYIFLAFSRSTSLSPLIAAATGPLGMVVSFLPILSPAVGFAMGYGLVFLFF